MEQAIFAAGCFWGVQYYFDQIPGVVSTAVGYTGGTLENPTYEEVCSHTTGHAEAILLEFDTQKVSYEILCKQFFRMHDPTQLDRQGPDVGDSYRSAIFYLNEHQKEMAEKVRDQAQPDWKEPIVTQIEPAGPFYEAEDYHQKYAERTGRGMCHIPYKAL
jgi:methionine-S-sulfoxide reductase